MHTVHRSSSFAYISQFSTGIEGSGIAGHKGVAICLIVYMYKIIKFLL